MEVLIEAHQVSTAVDRCVPPPDHAVDELSGMARRTSAAADGAKHFFKRFRREVGVSLTELVDELSCEDLRLLSK